MLMKNVSCVCGRNNGEFMLIRLLVLALLVFLGYALWTAVRRSLLQGTDDQAARPPSHRRGEEMVQDPQCGTYVPRHEAVEERRGGQALYFCSTACRDAYLKKSDF